MRARIFNLNAFYKYKKEIDKKNIMGLWVAASLFMTIVMLAIIMRMIINPNSIRPCLFVYVGICILLIFAWLFTRDRIEKAQDWFLIAGYIFGFTFACHMRFIYSDCRAFIIYFAIALVVACFLLLNPFFLLLGQIEGAVAFYVCYHVTVDGKVTVNGILSILAAFFISVLSGLLCWYVRMENLVFMNELNYITTGSDDPFYDASKAFWEGNVRYGLMDDYNKGKRKTFTIVFNLTKNKLDSVRENNIFDLKPFMDWDEAMRRILRYAGDPKTYRSFEEFFNIDNYREDFKAEKVKRTLTGNFSLRGGDSMWLSFELTFRPHPLSGEIMATIIVEDVTEDRILLGILNKLISHDYDLVLCIEKGKHNSLSFRTNSDNEVRGNSVGDYETEMVSYITECVADYDRERALKSGHLKNVYEELKTKDVYEVLLDEIVIGEDEPRKKHFTYSYLDAGKRFLIVLKQDVTDLVRKDSESKKQLEIALEEARAASNVKTEFLSRISHEMRTPMNAIIGLASLMEDEINNPTMLKDYVGKMKVSSNFLLQLINDMLDMSGIEEGHINIMEGEFSYKELIESIRTLILPLCMQKDITFVPNSEIADSTIIKSDRLRVTQVFMNLLGNAVKYTNPGGRIEFNSYNVGPAEDKEHFRFVIKDNGIGMSEDFIEHMFEPFTQEIESNRESLNGTGLGLSVTKGIVDALGGTISVTSKKNVGTTFVVDLFLTVSHEKETDTDDKIELNIDELEGKRVLIAEDNEINREIAVAILSRKSVLTDTAVNGAEAVERFSNSDEGYYDAILMDIRMPKMNGLEATRKIRSLNRKDAMSIPIIAMTANAFSDDVSLSAHSGMNAHLSKPINPNILYETVLKEIIKSRA